MATKDRFFIDKIPTDNGFFTFKHILPPVEGKPNKAVIYLVTDDVKEMKGKKILIVGEQQCFYLKDWQVESVIVKGADQSCDVVRLNQSFCQNPFTFRDKYEGFEGRKLQTFNDLVEIAKAQEQANIEVKRVSVPVNKRYKFLSPDAPRKNSPTIEEENTIKREKTIIEEEYKDIPF